MSLHLWIECRSRHFFGFHCAKPPQMAAFSSTCEMVVITCILSMGFQSPMFNSALASRYTSYRCHESSSIDFAAEQIEQAMVSVYVQGFSQSNPHQKKSWVFVSTHLSLSPPRCVTCCVVPAQHGWISSSTACVDATTRRFSFSCASFSPTTAVCNEAHDEVTHHSCPNTMTQATQISIQLLFSSFLAFRDSLLLRPMATSMCWLCITSLFCVHGRHAGCFCCIPSDRPCRLETSCKSFFHLHSETPNDTSLAPVHFSFLSAAPISATACLFKSCSSCIRELASLAVTHSVSH